MLGKTPESPLDSQEIQPVILKEISPEYSLDVLMLKPKLQYFGHLLQRTDFFVNTLMLGKIEGGRRRGRQSRRWLDGITYSINVSLSKLWDLLMYKKAWHTVVHGVTSSQTQWVTELNYLYFSLINYSLEYFIYFHCDLLLFYFYLLFSC